LGAIDLKGTPYQSPSIATGFGSHLAQPILRKEIENRGGEENISEEDAEQILKKCMKVLFYRDARSMNKVNTYTQQLIFFFFYAKANVDQLCAMCSRTRTRTSKKKNPSALTLPPLSPFSDRV